MHEPKPMEGVFYLPDLIPYPETLFALLEHRVAWNEHAKAPNTASFGAACTAHGVSYPYQAMLREMHGMLEILEASLRYRPTNCLTRYFETGTAATDWQTDDTSMLEPGTGTAIISMGVSRVLRFRSVEDNSITEDYTLEPGSMLYVTPPVQEKWQHCMPESDSAEGRISLTFRSVIESTDA